MRRILLLTFVPLFTMACFCLNLPGYDSDRQPAQPAQPTEEPLPAPETGDTVKVPHVITDVEVTILESDPPKLQLQVTGYQTDGCEFPVQVEQRREGNDIYVEIYRSVPIAATCIQVIVDYNETISLEGTFDSGQSYTIYVNDYTIDVAL